MTLKSNRCSTEIYKEPLLCRKKEFKSSLIKIVDSSSSLSLLAVVDSPCSIPASEDDCHLYKRRKMDEECNFLPTNGNMRDSPTRSFTSFGDNSSPVQNGDGKSLTVPSNVEVSGSGTNTVEYTTEYKEHTEASKGSIWRNSLGSHSNVDGRRSPSISSVASYINHKIKDAGECSSPDTNAKKPITELTSARNLCISMLKRDILPIKESEPSSTSTTIAPDDNESNPLFPCKSCGSMEDPLSMLICDCCEAAFHLSCCYRHIKKIPNKKWYCLGCSRKKPKRQREKLLSPEDGSPKNVQRPRRGVGPIGDMLVDAEPCEAEVRIGRDFQAKVPEWSGPISGNDDHFIEPSELDPTEMTILGFSQMCKDKKTSIGNWIQCREVLDTGVVCGKWRRAPLFVVQSSNWDCSCSVLWDPIHADCAVPQELETDEVLKQLKYINKLKNQLDNRNQKR